jgi:hypothetical protein
LKQRGQGLQLLKRKKPLRSCRLILTWRGSRRLEGNKQAKSENSKNKFKPQLMTTRK